MNGLDKHFVEAGGLDLLKFLKTLLLEGDLDVEGREERGDFLLLSFI